MNPYLTEDNQPTETLIDTLDYYGVTLDEFRQMPDEQVVAMVKRFSDVLNDGKISKSIPHTHDHKRDTLVFGGGKGLGIRKGDSEYSDSGSFSRYFDLDKWFNAIEFDGFKDLPESAQKTFPFLITPKASKSEKNKGCEGLPERNNMRVNAPRENEEAKHATKMGNIHATVKPLKLMSYLITLGSRVGDTVIDPFSGSGTTLLASQLLNRKCIGIEIEEKYCEIAANRCRQSVFDLREKHPQPSITT